MTPEEEAIVQALADLDNAYDELPTNPTAGATNPAATFKAATATAREAIYARVGVRVYATHVTLDADEARLAEVRAELGDRPFEEAFTPLPSATSTPPADSLEP